MDASFEPLFSEEPASSVRKVIAKRMLESKLTIPHFYLFDSVDMRKAVAYRATLNAGSAGGGAAAATAEGDGTSGTAAAAVTSGTAAAAASAGAPRISVGDMIVKAAATVLARRPECNAAYVGDKIRFYGEVNINVAVATDAGLLVPTLRNCDRKSLREISEETKSLAEKARNKKLRPREMMGGTFTVSNLGVFGLEGSFSIVNPPQALILTTGAIRETPVVRDGALAVGTVMRVTLSCDHRALDGAAGAAFLADFKREMEGWGDAS
jgi:pyruvate dehydrogenase E2 component (dihydrolipoamide acetyltransferase)